MCKSKAEGGQRCAAHARAAYEAAVEEGTYSRVAQAAAQYASTPAGRQHFTNQLDNSVDPTKQIELQMVLAEGDAIRTEASRTAAQQRGIRGNFSPTPTNDEISGFVWAAAGAAEVQGAIITRREVMNLVYALNENADQPMNITALKIRTQDDDPGYSVIVDKLEIGGRAAHAGGARFAKAERLIKTAAQAQLSPETLHQLSGDLGRAYGEIHNESIPKKSTPMRRALTKFDEEAAQLVSAHKLGIAQKLPAKVDQVTYTVDRRTSRSSSLKVTHVLGPDGRDATHHFTTDQAEALIRSEIGEFDELTRFHAMHDTLTVSRTDAAWRPQPM